MKQHTNHIDLQTSRHCGGGSLPRTPSPSLRHARRAGLSVTSPRSVAQPQRYLRAFLSYPCRGFILAFWLFFNSELPAQTFSLDSVIRIIEKQNPMLQEYDERIKAFQSYSAGARSWMAPMVGAGTFMTPYPNQSLMEDRDKGSWMFSIEQEIPNPAKINANQSYLESKASIERENKSAKFNELRSAAKGLYYQWLLAEQKLNVLRENESILKLMVELARIRYPYNQGSLGNIYMAEGRLSEIQNMIEMTTGDKDANSFQLRSLMNLPGGATIMIDTTTQIGFDEKMIAQDTSGLAQQRSDIRSIDRTIEVMRLNQQLQRVQSRPDFRIRFDHMQPIGNMPSQFTAMAMVSIPIAPWSSRMYKSEIRGMEYEIQAMKKNREAVLLETQGMLTGMATQLVRMKQQLSNYETKIIPALRKNQQTVMIAYEENREQLPMVIDAWEAMNMAQIDYLEKKKEFLNMIVLYERTLER